MINDVKGWQLIVTATDSPIIKGNTKYSKLFFISSLSLVLSSNYNRVALFFALFTFRYYCNKSDSDKYCHRGKKKSY